MKEKNFPKGFDSSSSKKLEKLRKTMRDMGSALIAYSGGVDSTFLLHVAKEVLREDVIAATAHSKIHINSELENAKKLASELEVEHLIIDSKELEDESFRKNPPDRCYYCKSNLFERLWEVARDRKIECVVDGSNLDDREDYRPGLRAADEYNVRSPLVEVSLTKKDVRKFSRMLGLPTWNKPSSTCLATRIPYGTEIDEKMLESIENLESFLRDLGIRSVRARHHGNISRIEMNPEDFSILIDNREEIIKRFRNENYAYVTLDLNGYRAGSMNKLMRSNLE